MLPNRIMIVAAGCLALSACAGDNPENVPLYGQWDMDTKLGSLTIDGMVVPPEMIPGELKALEGSESICGEPMFINRDWQQNDINRRVRGDCTVDEFNVTPTRVTGQGVCTGVAPEAGFSPTYSFDIAQYEDRYRMKLEIKGDATIPGQPGRHVIRVTAVQTGTRSGECG